MAERNSIVERATIPDTHDVIGYHLESLHDRQTARQQSLLQSSRLLGLALALAQGLMSFFPFYQGIHHVLDGM